MAVLVATDLAHATQAAVHTGALVARSLHEDLRLLHVVDFAGDDNAWRILYETADEIEIHATKEAHARLVAHYNDSVPEAYHRPFETAVRFGRPTEGILEECQAHKPSMIVVGTVGQSLIQDVIFGRTANQLVRQSHLPVLTVPPNAEIKAPRKLLVAMDLSKCGQIALEHAKRLAAAFEATLEIVHAVDVAAQNPPLSALVSPVQPRYDELLASRRMGMEAELASHGAASLTLHVELGRPDEVIRDVAARVHADWIVMGTHGRQGFSRFFLGSTAERVLRVAKVPTLVVSAPD